MSLKNKLNRLKSHMAHEQPKTQFEVPIVTSKLSVPFLEEWENNQVKPYYFDDQFCLIREVRYPISHQHGRYRFSDFQKAVTAWKKSGLNHPLSTADHEAGELFFFDTETTGLGGGVGNTIFLLGYASVTDTEVILKQHILPHPGAEVALYQSFLESINYRTLVTYNGKSFDWPQVKTRHTLVREHVPKLPPFGHFDLYHAARRMWKHKLERLKLSIVEKDILGVTRKDDIPGYLAPMIYFDYIERKDPEGMIGILKHNEIDILSLITLYTHLSQQLLHKDDEISRNESFEVGRWLEQLGEKSASSSVYMNLADGTDTASIKSKMAIAKQLKKEQSWNNALDLFLEVANSEEVLMQVDAFTEAAKIFEHKLRNFDEAFSCCMKVEELLHTHKHEFGKSKESIHEDLEKRIRRLLGKLQKFPG
ncbi:MULTISPECIES: ribonuclease H-like domain-containing protein [unclassified Bacillus (in: firmicutes)]|uniref:ribonuclease H-like domain-containing protein n=1 Tax=unclassified Bacillus (in: firmicutes) TaxID=185979 RepID=UPI0008E24D3C|nr:MULTISPECIES: ribonuclease H-like domain-containing protein [unclassified Bacillus (in: firmicutes)]SFA99067.1 hypothetical protein SAMN02799634_103408 [Bacillus sp. UNCCL13]SFQ81426.1 hypothetical protein SAMN04488577_2037 [Bacillus sp. cl95]